MRGRLSTITLAALLSTGIGCGASDGVAPPPQDNGDANAKPVLTVFAFSPPAITINAGWRMRASLRAVDQRGVAYTLSGGIRYWSGSPAIADVTQDGEIIGVAPGTAQLFAEVMDHHAAFRATLTVHVLYVGRTSEVTIHYNGESWQPHFVEVDVGTIVRWDTSYFDWSGIAIPQLWLSDSTGSFTELLILDGGGAGRRFLSPGTFRYCSGSCWDPPDFGTIRVRSVAP